MSKYDQESTEALESLLLDVIEFLNASERYSENLIMNSFCCNNEFVTLHQIIDKYATIQNDLERILHERAIVELANSKVSIFTLAYNYLKSIYNYVLK